MRKFISRRRSLVSPRPFVPPRPKVILITAQKFVWLFVLIIVLSLTLWAQFSGFFTIKHIYCTEGEGPCSEDIAAELERHQSNNILTFRAAELEEKILKGSHSIEKAQIRVSLPDTILVNLDLRMSTLTAATATNSGELVYIDGNHTPFQIQEKSGQEAQIISPKVTALTLGQPIQDPALLSAIDLAQTLQDYFISFTRIELYPDRLQVVLKNAPLALFPLEGNYYELVPSLQLILRETTIQETKAIDLRYSKPILRS
ncbi:MAG: FtsQ-type POTRA domain-containing protein [Candidatus Chisholmbacteria bacterium]|nr:FtsQ-type POTRA domain-containing protein [Candidatus Chisholmbacteria bacterium]